jgi:hypothetical protein
MSATNRGEDRYEFDDYDTPAWCVHRLLDRLKFKGTRWYEPCAGNGSIIRAVNNHYSMAGRKIEWSANEIQPKYEKELRELVPLVTIADLRMVSFDDRKPHLYDVYITNPPYLLAREVAEIGFQVAHTVILLLRLNFYGSKHRHPWISRCIPAHTAVLPDRPPFRLSKKTGKLGTDATEYAWFVWERPFARTQGAISLLNLTDPKILEADRARIRGTTPKKSLGKKLVPKVADEHYLEHNGVALVNDDSPEEDNPRYADYLDEVKAGYRK